MTEENKDVLSHITDREFNPKLYDAELTALANFLGAEHGPVWSRIIKGSSQRKDRGLEDQKSKDPWQFLTDWFAGDPEFLLATIAKFEPFSNYSKDQLMDVAIQIIEFHQIFRSRMWDFTEEAIANAVTAVKETYPDIWQREIIRQTEGYDYQTDPFFAQDSGLLRELLRNQPINWVEWDKAFHVGRLQFEVFKVANREGNAIKKLRNDGGS